jgi:hypothetical protein
MFQYINKKINFVGLLILAACSIVACKTNQHKNSSNTPVSGELKKQPTVYPTEPGTCIVQGYAVLIYPPDAQSDEPCRSFSCKAKVVLTQCRSCGYGIAKKPAVGDTLEINFIHSLASSEEFKTIYPAKVILPGLKQDQMFEGQLRIKSAPGDLFLYEITSYELLR